MFIIEYTILRDRDPPIPVERVEVFGQGLFGAEQRAILSFAQVQRRRRSMPPEGYRILDHNDQVVLRWQEMPGPVSAKRTPDRKTPTPAR